jgi:two-component system CheB/CheR fusion protein
VTDHLPVQPDRIYVIPPNSSMRIAQGVLKLQPREHSGHPARSIDEFFQSLAEDQRDRAIGVVLSGTGTDGTLGLEAIKAEGGIAFAQDDSAKYNSMPRSAVAAGCVDFALKPEDIARELGRIAKHPCVRSAEAPPAVVAGPRGFKQRVGAPERSREANPLPDEKRLQKILVLIRNRCGVDFSLYKRGTIERRVTRRMVLNKQETLEDYAGLLRANPKELDALHADLLINVTSFFRNPDAFDALKQKVFPRLLQQRSDSPLRVWVLGCSTGQEAYSLAMTLTEAADNVTRPRKLQIFATDLNDALLDKARHGLYGKALTAEVSPARLRRFFLEEEGGFRVSKVLREMIVFARQNLLVDPPFSRMDLISCRNLMIYLEPGVQQKLISALHYALKPEGVLFLGSSESVGSFTDLFESFDRKHKIYTRKAGLPSAFHLPPRNKRGQETRRGGEVAQPKPAQPTSGLGSGLEGMEFIHPEWNAQREADRITVNKFASPGVLINASLQILQFRGATGAYLEPPRGKATVDVLKMAREGLAIPLRATIQRAQRTNKPVRKEGVRVRQDGLIRKVNLEVIPLRNLRERCYLIFFESEENAGRGRPAPPSPATGPAGHRAGPSAAPPLSRKEESRRIRDLEAELAEMRDYLQSIQEQHEASHEELQASNEEIQSANEELQSINEELETSKEELESTNEELIVVNDELAHRNIELTRSEQALATARDYASNIIESVRDPLVVLDSQLRVESANRSFYNTFRYAPDQTIGQYLYDLGNGQWNIANLRSLLENVLPGHQTIENFEVESDLEEAGRRTLLLNARRIEDRTRNTHRILVVIQDVTQRRQVARELQEARLAEAVLHSARWPLLVLNAALKVTKANDAFYQTFKTTPERVEERSILDLSNGAWRIPELRALLEDVLPRNSFFNDFEITNEFGPLGRRTMLVSACPLEHAPGSRSTDSDETRLNGMILVAIEDITERQRIDAVTASLAAIVNSSDDAIIGKNLEGIITSWNKSAERVFGYRVDEALGQSVTMLIPPDRLHEEVEILAGLQRGEAVHHLETVRLRKDGTPIIVSLTSSPVKDASGRVIGGSKIVRDITERKRTEEAVALARKRYSALVTTLTSVIWTTDPEGRFIERQPAWEAYTGQTWPEYRDFGWTYALHPDDRDRVWASWKQALEERTLYRAAGRLWHVATGEHRHFESQAVPLLDEQGVPREWIGCVTDVHERKQTDLALDVAQRQLADRAGHLEGLVAERTADLRATNEQLEAFVYSIAHDLRAPLRSMEGFSSILVEEAGPFLSEEGRDCAQRLSRSTQLMDALLADLLAFSRIGQQEIDLTLVNAEPIVHSIISRLDAEILAKGARVEVLGSWTKVRAHAPTFGQVLFNLVSNALKFARPGVPPEVRIRAERSAPMRLRVWVEDNGIGIAPEHWEQIFRLFLRLNGDKFSGTGVGLAIVQKGVERMGGRVGLESVPGQGSRFWFELPTS